MEECYRTKDSHLKSTIFLFSVILNSLHFHSPQSSRSGNVTYIRVEKLMLLQHLCNGNGSENKEKRKDRWKLNRKLGLLLSVDHRWNDMGSKGKCDAQFSAVFCSDKFITLQV